MYKYVNCMLKLCLCKDLLSICKNKEVKYKLIIFINMSKKCKIKDYKDEFLVF